MVGTVFQAPLKQGGPDTGNPTTSTVVGVPFFKTVDVSAGGRDVSFILPDNAFLNSATGFVTVACSSLSQGGKILIGDGSTDNLYGTANAVQATGSYSVTMTLSAVSAKSITVKVTASVAASAAQFTQGDITINIIGGVKG